MAIDRKAIRALIITPADEVLLMRIKDPARDARYWVCPGGGIEPDESADSALVRELSEELGRADLGVGPLLYRWRHDFSWNACRYRQTEAFYLVETERFAPVMRDGAEAEYTLAFRWWTLHELRSSSETFSPREIVSLLERYRKWGAPDEVGLELVVSE